MISCGFGAIVTIYRRPVRQQYLSRQYLTPNDKAPNYQSMSQWSYSIHYILRYQLLCILNQPIYVVVEIVATSIVDYHTDV